jgi:hypothetical protein
MTAFAHWTAMHAWWVARRSERDAIGKPWPARKNAAPGNCGPVERQVEGAATPSTEPSVLELAQQRMAADAARPTATPRALPDEGGPVTDADVETMKKTWAAMSEKASAWATRTMIQGNTAPLPWNKLSVVKTVRRYELYRGVQMVARYVFTDDCDCDSNADDVVRSIVHAVTLRDIEPDIPPGLLLATLNAEQAAKFAEVAHDLAQNRYSLLADSTGVLRLAPVD